MFRSEELLEMREGVIAGRGAEIFATVLRSGDRKSTSEECVRSLFRRLESMWDSEQALAGYLMARLSSHASDVKAHDIYDAIFLYLHSSRDRELAHFLKRLAGEGVRPKLAKRLLAEVERIGSS